MSNDNNKTNPNTETKGTEEDKLSKLDTNPSDTDPNWSQVRKIMKEQTSKIQELETTIGDYKRKEVEQEQKELEAKGEYEKALEIQRDQMAKEKAKIEEDRLNSKIEIELIKAGADQTMAELLIEKAKSKLSISDLGTFTNSGDVINSLKEEYKSIFVPEKRGKVTPNSPTNALGQQKPLNPRSINDMSYSEYLNHVRGQ